MTGLVVNQQPNLARSDYDALRAELHRLRQQSLHSALPAAQQQVLQGRVAWACQTVVATRQAKLRALLAGIRFAPPQ